MKTIRRGYQWKAVFPLALALLIAVGSALSDSQAVAQTPTLTTDEADYAPGEVVLITGEGFAPTTAYAIPVMRPDGSIVVIDPDTHDITPGWDAVLADANGGFTYNYQLDGIEGLYEARAYPANWAGDWSETPLASVTFTDAPPDANLDQCANGGVGDPPVPCTQANGAWQNGSLNEQKAHYLEGDSLPYRAVLSNL